MTTRTYLGCPCPPTISFIQRLGSALLYGVCSILITIINKIVLTSYGYVRTPFLLYKKINFKENNQNQCKSSIVALYCPQLDFPHFNCLPLDR